MTGIIFMSLVKYQTYHRYCLICKLFFFPVFYIVNYILRKFPIFSLVIPVKGIESSYAWSASDNVPQHLTSIVLLSQ